jgi:O-antigen ligase
MSKLAYALLWVFTFSVPWENILLIPGLGSGPKGVGTIGRLVGLATAPIGVLAILARGRARPLALFHILAACFVLWGGLTVTWSVDPERTVSSFATAVQAAALSWLVWELAGTPKLRRGLLQAYVLGAYVSTVFTIVNYELGIASTESVGDRFVAEGFNPNVLGFLLVLALPIAWHLGITQQSAILRWINRLYLPAGMVGVLLTGSRSALIGAAVALILVPLTLGRLSPGMKAGVLSVVVAMVVTTAVYVPETTWARLSTTKEEITSGTLNERTTIWKAGLQLFPRYPIGGVGTGAFATAVKPFLGSKMGAHNTYLSVLIEQGVIGFALFSLMFLAIFFHARAVPPEERRFVLVLLLTLCVGLVPRAAEFKKVTWLMLGLLLAPSTAAALAHHARRWVPVRIPIQPRSQPLDQEPVRHHRGRLE